MAVYLTRLTRCIADTTYRHTSVARLYADSIEELHAVALNLSIPFRQHVQSKPLPPHYLITPAQFDRAVRSGITPRTQRPIAAFKRAWWQSHAAEGKE